MLGRNCTAQSAETCSGPYGTLAGLPLLTPALQSAAASTQSEGGFLQDFHHALLLCAQAQCPSELSQPSPAAGLGIKMVVSGMHSFTLFLTTITGNFDCNLSTANTHPFCNICLFVFRSLSFSLSLSFSSRCVSLTVSLYVSLCVSP